MVLVVDIADIADTELVVVDIGSCMAAVVDIDTDIVVVDYAGHFDADRILPLLY